VLNHLAGFGRLLSQVHVSGPFELVGWFSPWQDGREIPIPWSTVRSTDSGTTWLPAFWFA